MFWAIIFGCTIMSSFLPDPLFPGVGWLAQRKSFLIDIYFCIGFGGCFIYKQVVIATRYMVKSRKSFMSEKNGFFIT